MSMSKLPPQPVYWSGKVPSRDDFGGLITDTFVDGKTYQGPWGIMNMENWYKHSISRDHAFGLGLGQRYVRQEDGRWLKVEG